ncbi:uncharacterized protein C9orf85 homolog [Penaeus japonicus]|uniref:uncharacterized protein C9orf85 homolog n=1 Tax=Penaeus japonicus TaxID=27405 RepID=UPI001C713930|nr:uncharacterized protein C9orf85 homolog [Penaeus japonicus]
MSCKKGSTKRTRPQKYQNATSYRNNLHDTSKKTRKINSTEIAEVCKRCQEIIEWKIRYKKYKPLTQAKTCTKCHQKTVKDAYHTVCIPCASKIEVCCKCGKKEEIVQHKAPTEAERLKAMAELEREIEELSERKRRAYHRYMDKLNGKTKKKKKQVQEEDEKKDEDSETPSSRDDNKEKISMEEYFKNAREKIEMLKAAMEDNDFLSDFDDLDIDDDDDFEDIDSEDDE